MNFISIPPIVMATLMLYVGFYHFMIYRHQKNKRENLTFALSCFTVGIYSICCAGLYSVSSPLEGVQWQRFQIVTLAVLGIALLWFIHDYTGQVNKKIVFLFTIYYVFSFISGLFYRGELSWTSQPSIKEISLPFGYDIKYYEMVPGVLTNLQSLVGFIYFVYILFVSLKFYRLGYKEKGVPLLVAMIILFIGLMNDTFVSSGFYDSIYILEYSYIGIILVFTYFLTKIVLKASEIEIALRESEAKFRSLVESTSDWIWEVNEKVVYTYASPKVEEMLGYRQEEVIGKTPFNLMPPQEKERIKGIFKDLIEKGKPIVALENINLHKNGQQIVIETNGVPVLDAHGKVTGYRGVDRDITKRKQMGKTLSESEKKFRSITEQSHELISLTDENGVITYVSPFAEQLFIIKPENMIGRHFMDFLDESAVPLAIQEFQKSVNEGHPTTNLELLMKREDGSRFYGELNGSLFDYESTQGTLVVIRDITDRKMAEKALRDSEERYRLIADNVADVIWTMDMDFKFTYVSPSIYQLRGFTVEEAMQQSLEEIIMPDSFEIVMNLFLEKLALTESGDEEGFKPVYFEVEQPCKDGSIIWTGNNARILPNIEKKAASILGVTRDITQQRSAEEALRESEEKLARSKKMESLGLLAGGVAHDLNNVLSGIVSYPELILMDLPEDSKFRKPIETIKKSGQRAADIVQDLLTVARGVAVIKETINLNILINEHLDSLEFNQLKQLYPKVMFKTNLDMALFNTSGSQVHIKKVLTNLTQNAAEAIEVSGEVVIKTMNRYLDRPLKGYGNVKVGEYVVLSISDNGPGISSEDLVRIFEPFYTTKIMGRSGTGLGLAVVWNIMLDHKGFIDVKCDKKGTTFNLYFPINRDTITAKTLALPIDDYKGNGETILVVDDIESQREISCRMLEILGYKAIAVSSGEEAIDYLKDNSVDLILLDMIMDPGINGYETFKRIIETHPKQKAVIVSGYAVTGDVKAVQNLGAGKYIKKPYVIEEIGLAVKEEIGE